MHFYIDKTTNTVYYRETYGQLENMDIATLFFNKILNLYQSYGFDFAYHLLVHNIIVPSEFINNPNTKHCINKYFISNPEKKQHIMKSLDDLFNIANELHNTHKINYELIDTDPNTY